ncbi:membrane protein [Orientia tsutsugamushi]|nr:smpA / OmlA family protein [Orientia tsutsugamushi str. TA763]SPP23885.1 membrane protein [Orientia tsutsugamushi]
MRYNMVYFRVLIKRIFLLLSLLLILSASTIDYHGKYIRDEQIEQLQEKLLRQDVSLSKLDVINLIGAPSFISADNLNIWYYIHYTTKVNNFWFNKLLAQRIVILTFNADNDKLMRILVFDN